MLSKIVVRVVVPVIALAAVVWGVLYFLRPLAVTQAARRDVAANAVSGTLAVRAERSARLVSEVGGRIETSNLELGQKVSEGDVLIEVDSSALRIEIKQIEADIASIKRRLEIGSSRRFELQNQKDDLEVKKRLLERGSIARVEVERHERGIAQLEQTIELERLNMEDSLERQENILAGKKLELEKMTIRSPIAGVISEIFAYPDDLISPGTPIAQIISVARIVEAKISEESFANVEVGQHATVRFTGYGGKIFDAKVSKVLPAADPETQRYTVHLDVEIEPERLVAGLTGEALITVAQHENAIVIPRTALAGNRVYVVNDGKVEFREVTPGFTSLTVVEIVSGLEEGELVIVEELDRFRDGQGVRVREIEPDTE